MAVIQACNAAPPEEGLAGKAYLCSCAGLADNGLKPMGGAGGGDTKAVGGNPRPPVAEIGIADEPRNRTVVVAPIAVTFRNVPILLATVP